jgi:8-oxo-dGTP diphosphatase
MASVETELHVACAVVRRAGTVLFTQRAADQTHPLLWEFPGGKIDEGETAEACAVRELREELELDIVPVTLLHPFPWRYPRRTIVLHPLLAELGDDRSPVLRVHAAFRWLSLGDASALPLVPADLPILEHLSEHAARYHL